MSTQIPSPPNPPGAPPPAPANLSEQEIQALQEKIVEALRSCYDPEIPVNIYDLGLIYDTRVEPSGRVFVQMTLTAKSKTRSPCFPWWRKSRWMSFGIRRGLRTACRKRRSCSWDSCKKGGWESRVKRRKSRGA